MQSFARGLITGTIIGTAMGMMVPNMTNSRSRRRMPRNRRNLFRKASNIVEDMIDM